MTEKEDIRAKALELSIRYEHAKAERKAGYSASQREIIERAKEFAQYIELGYVS